MNQLHKGILIGLLVGALGVYFWQRRAGGTGSAGV